MLTEQEIFSNMEIGTLKPGSKVVVAMSGGVDSSLVATVLHKMGYEVIGITLQLYDTVDSSCNINRRTCCVTSDINDAKHVAEKIGFPHYTINYKSRFKQEVVDYFVESYINGETPLPCVKCNQSVKFIDLLKCAKDLEADALATGHYVRRVENGDIVEMHRAVDFNKDQSYFLFATTYEQLKFLRFPLGSIKNKSITREYAEYYNLPVSNKPDSQDICFVPNGNYSEVVVKIRPETMKKGDIVHVNGSKLGEHEGIINYTIGQRKGIKISYHEPLYVIKIDPAGNKVVVGPKESLATKSIKVKDINFLCPIDSDEKVFIKIRSNHNPIKGSIVIKDNQLAEVYFDKPEYGIAPGQACVVYGLCQQKVIGGGWISID